MRFALGAALLLAGARSTLAACPSVNHDELLQLLARNGQDHVIFFATWCAGCRSHVEDADARTMLVGTFDEPARVEEAVRRLAPPGTACAMGRGIAQALGIKAVPAEYFYRDGQLRRK